MPETSAASDRTSRYRYSPGKNMKKVYLYSKIHQPLRGPRGGQLPRLQGPLGQGEERDAQAGQKGAEGTKTTICFPIDFE